MLFLTTRYDLIGQKSVNFMQNYKNNPYKQLNVRYF